MIAWYYAAATVGSAAGLVVVIWWDVHRRNSLVRRYVIDRYGRDVPVDPDPGDGPLLEPVDWVDGTKPVACPWCSAEMEERQVDSHDCPGRAGVPR